MEELPTNKIPGFSERLEEIVHSFTRTAVLKAVRWLFFMRVKEGLHGWNVWLSIS
jgi:hypothetical protein